MNIFIKRTDFLSLLLLLTTVFAISGSAMAQIPLEQRLYRVINLDGIGGTSSVGSGINNRGWITGNSTNTGDATQQAVIWNKGGAPQPLGTLGGPNSGVIFPVKDSRSIVSGITETAQINPLNEPWSCFAFFPTPTPTFNVCVGFAWENGVMRPLPVFPGGYNGFASGANNQGQIVGWAENGVHDPTCTNFPGTDYAQVLQFRAALWGPGADDMKELPPLVGDSASAAVAINDRGQVVGISGDCGYAVGAFSAKHAVIWEDGKPTNIGNLGGVAWNTPTAINEQGVVVGFSNVNAGDGAKFNEQAFIWTKDGGIKPLGTLPGDTRSQASSINSRNQIVGVSRGAGGRRAVIWENGTVKDLNGMLASGYADHLLFANDINDKGEITGLAVRSTGESFAFLAVPVQK